MAGVFSASFRGGFVEARSLLPADQSNATALSRRSPPRSEAASLKLATVALAGGVVARSPPRSEAASLKEGVGDVGEEHELVVLRLVQRRLR